MRNVKIILFLCTLLVSIGVLRAQPNLYALTPRGGANNTGTILKFDANNKSKSPVKSFDYFDGTSPQASLANSFIKASDGLLYGTVPQGGNYDRGMIVSYDPATGVYTPKYHFKAFDGFNPADGLSPIGSLLQATDGKLYGVTLGDYADVKGSIYSFDPVTLTHTTLKVFDQPNDPVNSGSLIQASNGKLYGMGGQGGANSVGVIYSYDISTSTYTNLYHFETTNANMPSGNLLEENGKLFGITNGGGDNSGGAIFRFDPETTLFSSIYSFGAGSNDPNFFFSSSLSKAANGKFYGMSFMGGTEASGTIFSLDPTNFAFVKEYDFTAAGINYPTGNFMLGSDGKFYGTASGGGTYNGGAVFAFDPSNAGVTVLANLGSGNFDAKKPMGTLAEANGYLYGISEQGGFLAVGQSPTGLGTAYKVKLDGTNLETFHSFGVNTTGAHGSGGMIKVGNLLYGLTQDGGSKGGGTLFSYNPVSAELTVLHNFLDITDDGLHPYASLLHVNGKLYGTTQNGGKHAATGSDGVIFSYDIQNQTYEIVHNCGDITDDGYFLISTLIKDPNSSKIYGMSELGGTGDGAIFSFDPNTPGSYKIEYSFPGGDGGSSPYGSLAIKNGVLYGTTISGGTTNYGNLFSYDPGTSTYTNLASFDSNPASFSPFGSSSTPLIGSDGNIYLLTKNGGEFQLGTLSKYDFQTKTLSRIKDFKGAFSAGDDKDGAYPAGDLMTASDGKIYGMTTNGGNPPYPQYGLIDQGTIFSYDISTNTFQGEAFLDQAVGINPAEASFLVEFEEITGTPATFTAKPASTIVNENATYTTESGKSNYAWTIPGVLNTDYSILLGGIGSTDHSVTIKWLTSGSKTVEVFYDQATAKATNTTSVLAPSFIVNPSGTILNENATYTTESGKSNYTWTIPGTLNTDYNIVSGGGNTDNSVTLFWITLGSKKVEVTYGNSALNVSNTSNVTAPSMIASPSSIILNEDAIYTTESGKVNYAWTIPGTLNTDYTIVSGGGNTDNSVTIKWITLGSKKVEVTYGNAANNATNTSTVIAPSFTTSPASGILVNVNATYTTEVGKNNYVWTIPGVLNTDYKIIAGGVGSSSNTVTLQWLTIGSKIVTVTYGNAAINASNTVAVSNPTINNPATFIVYPNAQICVGATVSYTTQSGKTNYVWSVQGTKNIDYNIVSGSLASNSSCVSLKWLTTGQKIVTATYTGATSPASSTILVVGTPSVAFTGASTVCKSSTGNVISVPDAGIGATYSWTITNGTITAGKTTNSITYTAGTSSISICVTVKNSTGCSSSASKSVTISSGVLPTFSAISSLCKGSTAPALPAISNNGIRGTWSPAVISTASVGTKSYTFTPSAGQCASVKTVSVTIKNCSNTSSNEAMGSLIPTSENNSLHLKAVVAPNPTNSYFRLTLNSISKERVGIRVFDMMGRMMEERQANSGETLQLGTAYINGTYTIEIIQGNEKQLLKVVKR